MDKLKNLVFIIWLTLGLSVPMWALFALMNFCGVLKRPEFWWTPFALITGIMLHFVFIFTLDYFFDRGDDCGRTSKTLHNLEM